MKYFIAGFLLTFAGNVLAGPYHHGHRHHHQRHWHHPHAHNWIVPALITGAVVYAATRPDPVIVQQPTLILQPNQVIIDGVVYTKQIMIVNGIQQEVLVRQ